MLDFSLGVLGFLVRAIIFVLDIWDAIWRLGGFAPTVITGRLNTDPEIKVPPDEATTTCCSGHSKRISRFLEALLKRRTPLGIGGLGIGELEPPPCISRIKTTAISPCTATKITKRLRLS
jgi:hypothetical protein